MPIVLAPIVVSLALLALMIVALGMTSQIDALVRGIFNMLASVVRVIPFAGRLAESALRKCEQYIAHELGAAARGIDRKIGTYFHSLADLVRWVGRTLKEHATLLHALALALPVYGVLELGKLIEQLVARRVAAVAGRLAHVTRVVVHETPQVVKQTTVYVTRVVGATAATAAHVGSIAIPVPRARLGELEREVGRINRWIRSHGRAIGDTAAVALVGAALARLSLGWLRCNNVSEAGKATCRTDPQLLGSLLLDTLAIASVLSVQEFARELRAIEQPAVEIMGALVREWPN